MKKNININIGGIIFHIEEDGYDKLKNYLDSINKYFSTFDDHKEIIEDIEGRISEIFLAKLKDAKQVITLDDIEELIATMGTTHDFEVNLDAEPVEDGTKDQSKESKQHTDKEQNRGSRRLYRDKKRVVLGGVCSGLAYYFGVDPIWTRLVFLLAFINIGFEGLSGFIFISYLVLWIAVPENSDLSEDKKIKKLFRSQDDKVLGGVAGGLAAYFSMDPVLARVIFVLGIFAGGVGIIGYLILWIITPEAKTITEKMQMYGEPVTLSNIEDNVKKNFKTDNNESVFVRTILFPFRLLATVFRALGAALGPFAQFIVEAIRIVTGILLVLMGFILMVAFTLALAVVLGLGDAWEHWTQFGGFSPDEFYQVVGAIGLFTSYVVVVIPCAALILIGATIIVKRSVVKTFISWSIFGIWALSVFIMLMTIPSIIDDFRVKNTHEESKTFLVTQEVPLLTLNDLENDDYNRVKLKLRGHSDSLHYKMNLEFESRGSTKSDARENAKAADYFVTINEPRIIFDSDITLTDAPYRFQKVEATFFIPYGKPFKMDEELGEILRNTLHLNGYKVSDMEGNVWVFTRSGIRCTTCENDPYTPTETNEDIQTYGFENFNEIKLNSRFDFVIKQDENYVVKLLGDDDLLETIVLEQRGNILEIRREASVKWWNLMKEDNKVNLEIVLPELKYLEITGACNGELEGFSTHAMEIQLKGASSLEADIDPKELFLEATGASKISLRGGADQMNADLLGASELNAFSFRANSGDIRAAGASTVRVYVINSLKAKATGTSKIRFKGSPEVNAEASGFSSIGPD